jgi:hypothetical protein
MEAARDLSAEDGSEQGRPALRLAYLAQVDPERWFRDLWTYVELTEEDTGA